MADVGVAVVWQEDFVRGGGTRGTGRLVSCSGRLVHEPCETGISEGLLLDIAEEGIADLVDRAVPKDLEEWFVVYSDYQFAAPQYEVAGLVQGISQSQGLSWVPGLSGVCEPGPDQRDLPARLAAEDVFSWAGAVFLKKPVAHAVLGPVGRGTWACPCQNLHALLDHLCDDVLGVGERFCMGSGQFELP